MEVHKFHFLPGQTHALVDALYNLPDKQKYDKQVCEQWRRCRSHTMVGRKHIGSFRAILSWSYRGQAVYFNESHHSLWPWFLTWGGSASLSLLSSGVLLSLTGGVAVHRHRAEQLYFIRVDYCCVAIYGTNLQKCDWRHCFTAKYSQVKAVKLWRFTALLPQWWKVTKYLSTKFRYFKRYFHVILFSTSTSFHRKILQDIYSTTFIWKIKFSLVTTYNH